MPRRTALIVRRNLKTGAIRVVGRRRYGAARYGRGARRGLLSRGVPSVYNFKRKVYYENNFTVTAGGTAYLQAWDFQLGLLPNASDFTNLYDQYCIKKVVWKCIPKITQNEINSGLTSNNDLPSIHSAIDYDDGTNPTNINQLCEYQSHKMTRGNAMHTRVFVPKVELNVTSSGAVSSANAPKSYQWLDCDAINIPHRGLKVVVPPPATTGTTLTYDVMVTYYFACKSVL